MDVKELVTEDFLFSTDKRKLDIDFVYRYLSQESYWCKQVPRDLVEKSIEHAECIGIYHQKKQVGFARVITDYSTFAYLADVFIDPAYRGKSLSKNMMTFVMSFDFVAGLRRFLLATLDAHGLYAQSGFTPLKYPDRFMEKHQPDIYMKKE